MNRKASKSAPNSQHSEADAQAAVANLLRSLQGNAKVSGPDSVSSSQESSILHYLSY